MIKKLLCIAAIACFSNSMSQNIELRIHNGTALINGTSITVIDTVKNDINQDVPVEIDVKSLYTANTDIKVRKIELTTDQQASENAICWGICTAPITWGSSPTLVSDRIPMTTNQEVTYSGHVYPLVKGGTSTFRYVWFDVANPTDSTWVDVTFEVRNPRSVSVEEIKKETSLKIYPNPATDFVNIAITSNEINKKIDIIDLLGKKVYSQTIADNNANLKVNTSNFLPGIYFVSITSNNKSIRTSKIVVTK